MTSRTSPVRLLSTAALLIGAGAALYAMQRTAPNYTRLLAPIESRGDAGTFVRGRSLALRVDGVDVARRLRGKCIGGDRLFETTGVWVIVHATASSLQRPESLNAAALVSGDGTEYRLSDRAGGCGGELLTTVNLQPDVPVSGDLIFELPANALTGAELLAATTMFGLAPLDSQLRIRLGIDAETAAQRLAAIRDVYELRRR
jgi:hypothetical protein